MTEDTIYVRVPEEMYRKLEARALRAGTLEEEIIKAGAVLAPYRLTGVMTVPPTGKDAPTVFAAVDSLIQFAKGLK